MFGDRLKEIRTLRNLSQNDLAKLLLVSQQTVGSWEVNRTSPTPEGIAKIANILNVSTDYLLEKKENRYNIPDLGEAMPIPEQITLPIYGTISAGEGVLAFEDLIGYSYIDKKYGDGEHFFLQVSGDSMYPEILEGDIILVHQQPTIETSQIGVFIIDEENGFVKKFEYSKNSIKLISSNPLYPPRIFTKRDINRVRVVGKVIKIIREL